MRIVKASYEVLTPLDGHEIITHLERCGRICYKSEDKITADSAVRFVTQIKNSGHHAVLEHFNLSVKFICDRGFTHELVRHRIASFCQESTRYCNYSKEKFGNQITVVKPTWVDDECAEYLNSLHELFSTEEYEEIGKIDKWLVNKISRRARKWFLSCLYIERNYLELIADGATPQDARSVLPNSLKTEIVITANLREWMHIFNLRCSEKAHPSMRELMIPLRDGLRNFIPVLFDNEKTTCNHSCGVVEPYGFVPEAGCPVHDK